MKIYETKRLYVRSFTREDIASKEYLSWFYDPDVTRHNSHGLFPYTQLQKEEFAAELEGTNRIVWAVMAKNYPHSQKPSLADPGVDLQEPPARTIPKHIGNVTLQGIHPIYRSAEFAVIIGDKSYWEQGYTTEAATLLFDHGFKRLNLHRIWTGTAATNIGMRQVAKKLGMIHEGTFRQAMYLNGKYEDVYEYGILKHEWFEQRDRSTT